MSNYEFEVDVAVRIGRGEQPEDIAQILGVDPHRVDRALSDIVAARPDPRHQFETVSELREALARGPGVPAP